MKKQLLELFVDVIILPEEEFKRLCFVLQEKTKSRKEEEMINNLIKTAKRYRKYCKSRYLR